MGKTILTPQQRDFLELVQQETSLVKNFYLTGGTALAGFYYQHRLSEDIDLFTEKNEASQRVVDAFLRKIGPKLGVRKAKKSQFLGLVSYLLVYVNNATLKVDFNYYPFPRIEKGSSFKHLLIDSVHDIAANKVHTIFTKPRARDYIDLYFILSREDYTLKNLILDAKVKFDWDIDPITLASQFVRVRELEKTELPRMLIPLDRKDMNKFFLSEAKKLEKDIFK